MLVLELPLRLVVALAVVALETVLDLDLMLAVAFLTVLGRLRPKLLVDLMLPVARRSLLVTLMPLLRALSKCVQRLSELNTLADAFGSCVRGHDDGDGYS